VAHLRFNMTSRHTHPALSRRVVTQVTPIWSTVTPKFYWNYPLTFLSQNAKSLRTLSPLSPLLT